jgi:hypothetical protein
MWEVKTGDLLEVWHTGLNDSAENWQNYSPKNIIKLLWITKFQLFLRVQCLCNRHGARLLHFLKEKVWIMRNPCCLRLYVFVCPMFSTFETQHWFWINAPRLFTIASHPVLSFNFLWSVTKIQGWMN